MTIPFLNNVHKTFNLGLKHRMKCFSYANLTEITFCEHFKERKQLKFVGNTSAAIVDMFT